MEKINPGFISLNKTVKFIRIMARTKVLYNICIRTSKEILIYSPCTPDTFFVWKATFFKPVVGLYITAIIMLVKHGEVTATGFPDDSFYRDTN